MRHLRRPIGLAALLTCAFAMAAAPALAAEFTASRLGNTRGKNVGNIQFKFGIFKITCEKATEKGQITSLKSKRLYDEVKFAKCGTEARIGGKAFSLATKFKAPVDFEYHSNGYAETGAESESEVALIKPGAVELTVKAIKCVITWPAQTVPVKAEKKPEGQFSAVGFSAEEVPTTQLKRFPSGFQKKLLIANALKGMEYSFEEGQCEGNNEGEGNKAQLTGVFRDEVVGGDLSIQ